MFFFLHKFENIFSRAEQSSQEDDLDVCDTSVPSFRHLSEMLEDQSGKYQADLASLLGSLCSCLVQPKQQGRRTPQPQIGIVSVILFIAKSNFCSEMQFELLRIEQPLMRLCQTDEEIF